MFDAWGSKIYNKYDKLYEQFNIKPISKEIIEYFGNNYLFEREIIIAHRELEKLINNEFIIVTGFASSGKFHFGHKLIIDVYNFFRKFSKKGYFVICDVDAYVSRPDDKVPDLETAKKYAIDNIANALALGIKKDDIILQSKRDKEYYIFSYTISKKLTLNTLKATLGHTNLGKFSASYLQIADILYPQIENGNELTLIPVGIEQEPLIRLSRDVAKKFKLELPSSVYLSHLPSLTNYKSKMSSSSSAIFLDEINVNKIVDKAFTGGRDTMEEQIKLGGNPDICPVYSLLLKIYPDDDFVKQLKSRCKKGEILCGDDKRILKEYLNNFLEKHNKKYKKYINVAKKMVE